jgi:hypothetical protein
MAIYLSLRMCAALRACSVQAVHKEFRAGHFGAVLRHGGRVYAEIAAVERRLGRRFTTAQLVDAGASNPHDVLIITPEEEAA